MQMEDAKLIASIIGCLARILCLARTIRNAIAHDFLQLSYLTYFVYWNARRNSLLPERAGSLLVSDDVFGGRYAIGYLISAVFRYRAVVRDGGNVARRLHGVVYGDD